MIPDSQKTEKNFARDLKTFEQLPAKSKELDLLKDQAEKSTGQESVVLNRKILDRVQSGAQAQFLEPAASQTAARKKSRRT